MTRGVHLATLILVACAASGQATPSEQQALLHTIRSTSTLVEVPALVRSSTGDFVTHLSGSDFRLTDNGIEQKVLSAGKVQQPVALMVLMQTGGAASSQFQNYRHLYSLINAMMGNLNYRIALVTFGSKIEEIWNFPSESDGVDYSLTHPKKADGHAAIRDAVDLGIGLLQQQPPTFRRIIVLLSQSQDDGSKAQAKDVVKRIGESDTIIYSVTFPPEVTRSKEARTRPDPMHSSGQLHPDLSPASSGISHFSAPLSLAIRAMRQDTAKEMATLSGGEYLEFKNDTELKSDLSALANEIPDYYALSFHPDSKEPGFHSIEVEAVKKRPALRIVARASYWMPEGRAEN